jgi:hypothetical protein
MESKFHIINEIKFLPSTLTIQLTSVQTGEPVSPGELPLTVTNEPSKYLVSFEKVGRFRVISESFNEFKEPYEKITNFVYRMIDSKYLQEYGETAKIFAYDIPYDANIEHYAVHSEFYVVDVLAARSPTVEMLDDKSV